MNAESDPIELCPECEHAAHPAGPCEWEGYEFDGAEGHEFECECEYVGVESQ